jgi:CheY-like chemotaxis protein
MQRALWSDQSARVVMIIDDSIITRKILEVSLQRNDISWISFSNVAAALQALKQQTNLIPAVVLLDIELPDMDGFVIARLLRHQPKYNATAIICQRGSIAS